MTQPRKITPPFRADPENLKRRIDGVGQRVAPQRIRLFRQCGFARGTYHILVAERHDGQNQALFADVAPDPSVAA